LVTIFSFIFRKEVAEVGLKTENKLNTLVKINHRFDFFFKQISLVEEKYKRRGSEKSVVDYGAKELKTFNHSVNKHMLFLIAKKHH